MDKKSKTDTAAFLASKSDIPQHVAVIMDGNGRWAKSRGLLRIAGHRKGVERVRDLVTRCVEKGIKHLTLFAFSSENWRRPAQEVQLLMDLFLSALDNEIKKLHKNNVRFRVIGDISRFGDNLISRIRQAETMTLDNKALTLTIAANYGGRWDIAQACAQLARRVQNGETDPATITEASLEPFLSLADAPEPDLFIRTGGEQRISNFLLWQLAYTEMYFTPVLWPDFDRAQFEQALASYAGRQRRFGLTGDQIEAARRA
ncbi:MAG: polyprenyl diphosphate synthase [Gammaproteobacteria bacterium]|nr:polyprenyl diphosphate synthase [Gammaproteobacteria bacterium]MDH3370891.1 polyprenyl diphosphate synthase [Gammaproteobacteria bacterium]MDH3405438.1 polyprenyl diphosphate synthase [Gammaproteobacteria bacterium]MDH3562929.1 polyprenyl diphosphate synthase [Gammaproteobacteria bacterium]MDH5486072.1 polyprenyl diphosphate synthase [Gammaproteobacteria bacterium]